MSVLTSEMDRSSRPVPSFRMTGTYQAFTFLSRSSYLSAEIDDHSYNCAGWVDRQGCSRRDSIEALYAS